MEKPSKADFEQLEDLNNNFPSSSISFDQMDIVTPDEKLIKEKFSQHWDISNDFICKFESLTVYKWACNQYAWRMFKKALFNTESPQRSTKKAFVEAATKGLLSYYAPFTKVDYYLYKKSYERRFLKNIPRYNSYYGERGYSKADVERRYRKTFHLESLDHLNNEQTRLDKFNRVKERSFWFDYDLEVGVLLNIGRYFYEDDYLDEASGNVLIEPELASYYENRVSFYSDSLTGLEKLVPVIEHFITINADFVEAGSIKVDENLSLDWSQMELKQNIDLLLHLEDIRERITRWHDRALSSLNGEDELYEPIIKRVDRTAKERVLAHKLWNILKEYKKARPVRAIEWLLQLEGIENIPERRTIERWLASWDKKNAEERQLGDMLLALDL